MDGINHYRTVCHLHGLNSPYVHSFVIQETFKGHLLIFAARNTFISTDATLKSSCSCTVMRLKGIDLATTLTLLHIYLKFNSGHHGSVLILLILGVAQ